MGTILNKITPSTSREEANSVRTGRVNAETDGFLSRHDLDLETIRHQMMARRILHSISETPREKLIENITNYRRRDAKALAVCFNDVEDCRYDIVGIITERLHCGDMFKDERPIGDYHLPTTNYANVDNFIDSNYSIPSDAMKPPQTLKYPTSMSNNANPDIDVNIDTDADSGADVMQQ